MNTTGLPTTMQVLRAHHRGGPDVLEVETTEVPAPGPDEVLVAVHAAAITFDELRWDETWSHLPSTPSHEWSGVVAGLGSRAAQSSGLALGDEVFGMVPFDRNGAAAEYVVVPSDLVAPKPTSLTHLEAAALPLAGLTAQQALVDHGHVGASDDVLVLGAAGGVGSFAVQLALQLGAKVTVTAFSKDVDHVTSLGAHRVHTVDGSHDEPLQLGAYDVVLDTVGGPGMHESMALARRGGTYITLQEPAPPDRLAELGVTGRFFIVTPSRESLRQLGSEVATGGLRVTIASTFPLLDGRSAFESGNLPGRAPGKTVLVVKDPSLSHDEPTARKQTTALPELARELLALAAAAGSGRSARTVYGGHGHQLRQTLITLVAGRQLANHLVLTDATLFVLSGKVILRAGDVSYEGSPGDVLAIPRGHHSVAAAEDSAVLLTVTTHP